MKILPGPDRRSLRATALLCAVLSLSWPLSAPAQPDVYVYPAGCFDSYGRPLKADPNNPANSIDPACRPPGEGAIVRGSRSGASPGGNGGPSMQPGALNLPPTPVPVPAGIGVMNP